MDVSERRNEIIRILCRRRFCTTVDLALEFEVSERTIRRDIDILSLTYPIYTTSGKHGGIYLLETFSIDRMYMNEDELTLLKKLAAHVDKLSGVFSDSEKAQLHLLIRQYTRPQVTERN